MVIEKKYYDIAQRELEEMQREINAEKAQMSEEEILVQKFLNKWTIFLFCSILFSSNQKEH